MIDQLNLDIGQVVYLFMVKETKVLPMQVSQRVRRESLEGNSVDYAVILPGDSSKTFDLRNLINNKGVIFTDFEKLQVMMIENATNAINEMLAEVADTATKHFNIPQSVLADSSAQDPNVVFIELPDGSVAKYNANAAPSEPIPENSKEENQS